MEGNYRTRIADIKKCLEHLDEAGLPEEVQKFIAVAWANLSLACAEKFNLEPESDHSLITMKTHVKDGYLELELSKANLNVDEQKQINCFIEACKNGLCCEPLTLNECMDKYREIKELTHGPQE